MASTTSLNGVRVAVDVDGVLAEQVEPVLKRVYPGGAGMRRDEIVDWKQPLRGTDSNIKDEIEMALTEEKFVLEMEPIPGAVSGVQRLHEGGCHITIATARHPDAEPWTRAWLARNRIPFHDYLSTYGRDKGNLGAELLVDDYPGNLAVFAERGGLPILLDQPWNRKPPAGTAHEIPRLRTARSWVEVIGMVEDRNSQ